MNWKSTVFAIAAILLLAPSIADAQGRRRPPKQGGATPGSAHKLEIIGFGNYTWTVGRDFFSNTLGQGGVLDIKSSPSWGVELDVNVVPGGQLQLLYRRQDSDLQFRSGFNSENIGMSTEYWHIGGLGFIPGADLGTTKVFSSISLGATRYAIDGLGDNWRFSTILGLGVKAYLSPRIGLMLRGTMPMTFFSGGFGMGVGTGGGYVSVGGSGMAQFDVTGGLIITL